jgi:hypothetical protein
MNLEKDYTWSGVNYKAPAGLPSVGTTPTAVITKHSIGAFIDPTKPVKTEFNREFGNRWCKKTAHVPTAYDEIPVSLSYNPKTTQFMDIQNYVPPPDPPQCLPGHFVGIKKGPQTSYATYGHSRWPYPGVASTIPQSTAFTPASLACFSKESYAYPSYLMNNKSFPPPPAPPLDRDFVSCTANVYTGSAAAHTIKPTGVPRISVTRPLYEDDVFHKKYRPMTEF